MCLLHCIYDTGSLQFVIWPQKVVAIHVSFYMKRFFSSNTKIFSNCSHFLYQYFLTTFLAKILDFQRFTHA